MSAFERLALSKLAQAARDETRLAWPSQPTIAAYVGCSKNAIGPALQALEGAGHISTMPARPGLLAVYLVHPGGRAMLAPVAPEAVKAHLARGKFDAGSMDAVLIWLAQLGVIAGGAALKAVCRGTARALSANRNTTPTAGVVSEGAQAGRKGNTPNHWAHPPQPLGATTPTIGVESVREPEMDSPARNFDVLSPKPPADRVGLPGPDDATEARQVVPLVTPADMRALIDAPALPGQVAQAPKAVRANRIDCTGTPAEFLQRMIDAGGGYARTALAIPEGDRLAWAAKQQQLHGGRSSNVKAAA